MTHTSIITNNLGEEIRPLAGGWVRETSRGVFQASREEAAAALAAIGEWLTTPALGHWALDGVRIDNPAEELGEGFDEVVFAHLIKEAEAVFIRGFSDDQISSILDDRMKTAMAAEMAAAAKQNAAFLAELASCKLVVEQEESYTFGRTVSAKWVNGSYRKVHSVTNLQRVSKIKEMLEDPLGTVLLSMIRMADCKSIVAGQ